MFLLQNVSKKAPAGYHFGLPLGGITGRALTLPERLGPMGDRLG